MSDILTMDLVGSTLRMMLPMAFAVLGGLLSERSGIAQIGLEGMMLASALAAASTTHFFQSTPIGILAGMLTGMCVSLLMAVFVIKLKAEHIIVGTAINLLCFGLAPFVTKLLFDSTGTTPAIPIALRYTWEFYAIFALVFFLFIYIYHWTQLGLRIRFAGENPKVLVACGISPERIRWFSLATCGMLAGLGGSTLSLMLASAYSPMMTAGRGFMALAAIIFGAWHPLPALGACLFFAFTDALQIRLQGSSSVPVQFIQILPYVITIVALAGFYKRSKPPQSIGIID